MSVGVIDDSTRPEVVHAIRNPHKTQQRIGRKCLRAGPLYDISSWLLFGRRAVQRRL